MPFSLKTAYSYMESIGLAIREFSYSCDSCRAIRTELRGPFMVVTKRDQFLRSRVANPKDVESVVVIIRPIRNFRRIPTKSANEVSGHSSQLVVLPSD